MVGILVSFWETLVSGAMLVSGRVYIKHVNRLCYPNESMILWLATKQNTIDHQPENSIKVFRQFGRRVSEQNKAVECFWNMNRLRKQNMLKTKL